MITAGAMSNCWQRRYDFLYMTANKTTKSRTMVDHERDVKRKSCAGCWTSSQPHGRSTAISARQGGFCDNATSWVGSAVFRTCVRRGRGSVARRGKRLRDTMADGPGPESIISKGCRVGWLVMPVRRRAPVKLRSSASCRPFGWGAGWLEDDGDGDTGAWQAGPLSRHHSNRVNADV